MTYTSNKPEWYKEEIHEECKRRVLRAIKHGNHEPKYIYDYLCKSDRWAFLASCYQQGAINALKKEGVIKYVEHLEGYYLVGE